MAATQTTDRLGTLAERARAIVGPVWVLSDPAQLSTYECDGLTNQRERPGLVVLPASTDEVAGVVRRMLVAVGEPVAEGQAIAEIG